MSILDDLAPKRRRFVLEYCKDHNGTQAALRAGYTARSAAVTASRLLTDGKVQAALKEAVAAIEATTQVTVERIEQEYARIAFAAVTDVVEWDEGEMRLRPSAELHADVLAAVAEVSTETTHVQDADPRATPLEKRKRKVRMHDKLSALKELGRRHGFVPGEGKLAIVGPDGGPVRVGLGLSDDAADEMRKKFLGIEDDE